MYNTIKVHPQDAVKNRKGRFSEFTLDLSTYKPQQSQQLPCQSNEIPSPPTSRVSSPMHCPQRVHSPIATQFPLSPMEPSLHKITWTNPEGHNDRNVQKAVLLPPLQPKTPIDPHSPSGSPIQSTFHGPLPVQSTSTQLSPAYLVPVALPLQCHYSPPVWSGTPGYFCPHTSYFERSF